MLRFEFFHTPNHGSVDRDGAGVVSTDLAYLINQNGQVVPSRVGLKSDAGICRLECEKVGSDPACLAIGVDAPSAQGQGAMNPAPGGMIVEQTTLLPERDEPYSFWLELARRRIMLFLNKLEEWGLVDDPDVVGPMEQLDRARELFTDALVIGRGKPTLTSDTLGKAALASASHACELLTNLYSCRGTDPESLPVGRMLDSQVHNRSRLTIGCSVSPGKFADALTKTVERFADFVHVPMTWSKLEPREGRYSFAQTDQWIEWAIVKAKRPVVTGPVLDFRAGVTPDWLSIWENDFDTLREMVHDHAKQIVTRYRRTTSRWIATSSIPVNEQFHLTYDKMVELTRLVVLVIRKLHPRCEITVDIARPWGQYAASNRDAISPMVYAHLLNQSGVKFDSLGVRIQMNRQRGYRDSAYLAELIDMCAELDRPLHVTCLGAPGTPALRADGVWSGEEQAAWLERTLPLLASHHAVASVCWQELMDADPPDMMAYGGLLDSNTQPKPALEKLLQFRAQLIAAWREKDKKNGEDAA